MAQAEDTELRDLVIEALEKNGSLAKVRALLRANIFLAFEDDSDHIKQNMNLDNVLKLPEGILSLSIIHEFLEYCNLKNTLFVYMPESRQGKSYKYEGPKILAEKLNLTKRDNKEPLLVTLLRNILKKKYFGVGDNEERKSNQTNDNYKDDHNCTYIVHEDSSSVTSNSQSDNSSSDEKNKLHLRLPLDNSDTDTSSDTARDKTSSEYIPSEHIIINYDKNSRNLSTTQTSHLTEKQIENKVNYKHNTTGTYFLQDIKASNSSNSSTDSTSYAELKSHNSLNEKLLNTTGLPTVTDNNMNSVKSNNDYSVNELHDTIQNVSKSDSISPACIEKSISSTSSKNDSNKLLKTRTKISPDQSAKSDVDYSNDFTLSNASHNKDFSEKQKSSAKSGNEVLDVNSPHKNTSVESPHQDASSQSSQSSISISDVADLISEKSPTFSPMKKEQSLSEYKMSKSLSKSLKFSDRSKSPNNDSGDFSESPVPSLSNLSLDIHSD